MPNNLIATIKIECENGKNEIPVYTLHQIEQFTTAFDRAGTKYIVEFNYQDEIPSKYDFLIKSLDLIDVSDEELINKATRIQIENDDDEAVWDELMARFIVRTSYLLPEEKDEWAELIEV